MAQIPKLIVRVRFPSGPGILLKSSRRSGPPTLIALQLCRTRADSQPPALLGEAGARTRDVPPVAFLADRMPLVPANRASGTLLLPADHGYLYPIGQNYR
jgi:hypothetical protein